MFKFLCSKKGFTLVELMIVVVVLTILLAVGIPAYTSVIGASNKKICAAQIVQLKSEAKNWCILNNFNADYNYKITTVDDKATITSWEIQLSEGDVELLLNDVHKGKVSACPAGGTYYLRVVPATVGSVPTIECTCDCEAHQQ